MCNSEKLLMMDRGTAWNTEFYSKNKFEKLVHLVGFIIRIWLNKLCFNSWWTQQTSRRNLDIPQDCPWTSHDRQIIIIGLNWHLVFAVTIPHASWPVIQNEGVKHNLKSSQCWDDRMTHHVVWFVITNILEKCDASSLLPWRERHKCLVSIYILWKTVLSHSLLPPWRRRQQVPPKYP